MSLVAGARLGPYEIVAPIGAGGMGEVYRARDTRLERTVAIKVLPPELNLSSERKQRFEREAKAISSLQHPNICVLYDIGEQDGVDYLVMEYLEGESLADRLRKGPLASEQLLKTGIEIADALDKAHRQGLIHRDLKPGNVMLTKSGAKLLDFGLAKPAVLAAAASHDNLATLTSAPQPVTARGAIVGTFQYMAPEQLQGQEADARSDIFAFGALLYEGATGKPAFTGKTQISLMSAILERQPEPVTSLNAASPPALDYVIRTCLAKEPDDRFQTAHDISLQLKWIAGHSSLVLPMPVMHRRRRKLLSLAGWIVAVFLVAVLLATALLRRTPEARVTRFAIALPPRLSIPMENGAIAISSDGAKIAYVAVESGKSQLYVRPLDQFDAVAIPDSEGAVFPTFSPDGESVLFFAQGHLKKAPSSGRGQPLTIANLSTYYGGSWLSNGDLIAATSVPPLVTLPADGGTPKPVPLPSTRIDPGMPITLPGGDWILFTDDKVSNISILALRLRTGEIRMVLPNASQPRYMPNGYLLYSSSGTVSAVPFDAKAIRVTGPPVIIEEGVAARNFFAQYDTSETGTAVYAPGVANPPGHTLMWVDRQGKGVKLDAAADDYVDPSISPDGKHFVVCVRNGNEQSFAVYDNTRKVLMRMSGNGLRNVAGIWSPDGKTLYFDASGQGAKQGIYRMSADGSGAPLLLRETSTNSHISSVFGGIASVTVTDPVSGADLWTLSLDGREMKPFRNTKANERQGSYSPDGKYLAYSSDESGRVEIYVESAGASGARWQISTEGGEQPRWSRKGNEIFFRNGTKMMSVKVQANPFSASKAVELFDADYDRGGAVPGYDVSPDGQHFLMIASQRPNPTELRVVTNWPATLNQKTFAPARP